MGLNPISLIPAGLQALGGIAQAAFSGQKRKTKDLMDYANSYTPNSSIQQYYNDAMNNYDPNAYNSAGYRNQTNLNARNLATGVDATQTRRGGLGAIGGLVQGANDANAQATAAAQSRQSQQLNQLGQATTMKAAEDAKKFNMIYNIKAQRAAAATATQNMGLKNVFGGLSNASSLFASGNADNDNTDATKPWWQK